MMTKKVNIHLIVLSALFEVLIFAEPFFNWQHLVLNQSDKLEQNLLKARLTSVKSQYGGVIYYSPDMDLG